MTVTITKPTGPGLTGFGSTVGVGVGVAAAAARSASIITVPF